MILKYIDKDGKEHVKHDVIMIRSGYESIEYQFKNKQCIEVENIKGWWIGENE